MKKEEIIGKLYKEDKITLEEMLILLESNNQANVIKIVREPVNIPWIQPYTPYWPNYPTINPTWITCSTTNKTE